MRIMTFMYLYVNKILKTMKSMYTVVRNPEKTTKVKNILKILNIPN